MSSQGFFPLITHPTRPMSNTLINNIFTNVLNSSLNSGVFITDISDHFPIFTLCHKIKRPEKTSEPIKGRIFSERSIAEFRNQIASTNWDNINSHRHIRSSKSASNWYTTFQKQFSRIYNACFPYKEVSQRRYGSKPWITTGLRNSCLKKNTLYKNFLIKRTTASEQRYKTYKNKPTSILGRAEQMYYSEELKNKG